MAGTSTSTTDRAAARVEPPAAALAFLPDADYADAFALRGAPSAPAQVWAELALASRLGLGQRLFGTLVWHGVLGFDLAPPGTDGTLVGWRVEVDEPQLFVLTTDGSLMSGAMVFATGDATVTWTTALRYRKPRGRAIWGQAQRVHRALAGRLLARAASAIQNPR